MEGGRSLYGPVSVLCVCTLSFSPPEDDLTTVSCLLLLTLVGWLMLANLLVLVLTASLLGEVVMPSWGLGMPPPSLLFLFSDFVITGDFLACELVIGPTSLRAMPDSLRPTLLWPLVLVLDSVPPPGFLGNVEVWKISDLFFIFNCFLSGSVQYRSWYGRPLRSHMLNFYS